MARKTFAVNVNGDFEANINSWSSTAAALSQVDTPGTHSWAGTKSLQCVPNGTSGSVYILSEDIAVVPGRVLTVTGSAYGTSAVYMAYPRVQWFDASGTYLSISGTGYSDTVAGQWTTRTATVTAPANAYRAKLAPSAGNTPTATWLLDEFWANGNYTLGVSATATPTAGDWKVTLNLSTDAALAEYGSYRIQRDGVTQVFLNGALPATWTGTQPAGTTSTWGVQLMKDVSNGSTLFVPIVNTTVQVTTESSSGASLITNLDGSAYAWAEIQSWPEWRYTRRTATMQIMGSRNPVVTNDVALRASSTPVFLTRTTADRDALDNVLSQAGPLRIQPYCDALDRPYVMPLDYTQTRYRNKAADGLWLTEVNLQHIDTPTSVQALAMPMAAYAEDETPEEAAQ